MSSEDSEPEYNQAFSFRGKRSWKDIESDEQHKAKRCRSSSDVLKERSGNTFYKTPVSSQKKHLSLSQFPDSGRLKASTTPKSRSTSLVDGKQLYTSFHTPKQKMTPGSKRAVDPRPRPRIQNADCDVQTSDSEDYSIGAHFSQSPESQSHPFNTKPTSPTVQGFAKNPFAETLAKISGLLDCVVERMDRMEEKFSSHFSPSSSSNESGSRKKPKKSKECVPLIMRVS